MKLFRIESSRRPSPTVLNLVLRPVASSDRLSFVAGQYAAIRFRRNGRPTPVRCFSIVSSPLQADRLEFGIRLGGAYTSALAQLEPGEVVEVMGAYGSFVLPTPAPERVVMLAGGIGVTPFVSQIRTALSRPAGPHITLLHAVSSAADAPFRDELIRLSLQYPGRFKVVYAVGDGKTAAFSGAPAAPGRVTPAIIQYATGRPLSGQTFLLCGPPGFMKTVSRLLKEDGVPRANIISEAFSQTAGDRGVVGAVTLRVYAAAAAAVASVVLAMVVWELKETAEQIEAGAASSKVAVATPAPSPAPTASPTPAITAEPEESEDSVPAATPAPTARPIAITPAPVAAPTPVAVSQPPRSGVS